MKYKKKSSKKRKIHRTRKRRHHGGQQTVPQNDVGFIITRCVKKPEHNRLYRECYLAIRKFHPDLKVVIIDDNSDKSILEEIPMDNVEIIQSEYPGAGEYLPYYYLLTRKLFKKAIILQDSTFVNTKISYEDVTDYMFFYEFIKDLSLDNTHTVKILQNTKIPDKLIDYLWNGNWKGCYGTFMIITYDFLQRVEDIVGITGWKTIINNRDTRIALEKALPIACIYVGGEKPVYSMFGSLTDTEAMKYSPGGSYSIDLYLNEKTRVKDKLIKVWNSR